MVSGQRLTRRFVISGITAFAVMAGMILSRYSDEIVPAAYLIRPLLIVAAVAVALAILSLPARGYSPLVALILGALTLNQAIGLVVAGLVAVLAVVHRRWPGIDLGVMAPAVALIFLAVGAARAAPLVEMSGPDLTVSIEDLRAAERNRPMYVVLLDGYPRLDSLDDLGIDNRPFINALEQRGFTHYRDAWSPSVFTEDTLTDVLNGYHSEPPGRTDDDARRERRAGWKLPNGFVAIDPPIAHVTLPEASHYPIISPSDFEADLLRQSLVGLLLPDQLRAWLGRAMLDQHRHALDLLGITDESRVFAHLIAPHGPWVFGTDETRTCWPQCGLFSGTLEETGMSLEDWIQAFKRQLEGLNAALLDAIDQVVNRHPDAAIILFSDHGARWSDAEAGDEWHRTFLAARTPERPNLYADEPFPRALFPILINAYGP